MPTPYPNPDDRATWPAGQDDDDQATRDYALRACRKLADFGITARPTFDPEDGLYRGLIAVEPGQLFDLLNDLDLRALEA
ncbi:hypothetical protein [Kribbella lupini]|uniref:Uncharacterized protein n=1 Tax=Kribbella lupini TaxID=291602 RepID=A0ABN2CAA2_9ACTN